MSSCGLNQETLSLNQKELTDMIAQTTDFDTYFEIRKKNLTGIAKMNLNEKLSTIRQFNDQYYPRWEELAEQYSINYSQEDEIKYQIISKITENYTIPKHLNIDSILSNLFVEKANEEVIKIIVVKENGRTWSIFQILLRALQQCTAQCRENAVDKGFTGTNRIIYESGCIDGCNITANILLEEFTDE
jgi:hypothetical protein